MIDFQGMANGKPVPESIPPLHIQATTNAALIGVTIKALRNVIAETPVGHTPVLVMNTKMATAIINALVESQRPRPDLVAIARKLRRQYLPWMGIQCAMTLGGWISSHDLEACLIVTAIIFAQAWAVFWTTKQLEFEARSYPQKGSK